MGRPVWSTTLQNTVQRLAHGIRIATGDECPASGISVHKPLFVEGLDRLTNGGTADTKLLREFAFRRKLISFLQSTLEDGFLDLLNNLFVKTRRLDHLIHDLILRQTSFSAAQNAFASQAQSRAYCATRRVIQNRLHHRSIGLTTISYYYIFGNCLRIRRSS